mgnify:FL=1
MNNINLNLTVNDVNVVLQALGNAPYAQVFELIEKIRDQAGPQVQEQPKTLKE